MSHDTATVTPDRATAAVVVETFDGWTPDLSAPLLSSICIRTEAASR